MAGFGFTSRLAAVDEDEQHEPETPEALQAPPAPEPQPAPAKVAIAVDARHRDRAFSEGYAKGIRQARDCVTRGESIGADLAVLLCEAIGDERRGKARAMAEGRFAGYIAELERIVDSIYDQGVRLTFGAFDEHEVARELYRVANSVAVQQLAPLMVNDALAELWDATAPK